MERRLSFLRFGPPMQPLSLLLETLIIGDDTVNVFFLAQIMAESGKVLFQESPEVLQIPDCGPHSWIDLR